MRHKKNILASLLASSLLAFAIYGTSEAEDRIHISPEDLLDRIIDSAKADAFQILADTWAEEFSATVVFPELFPNTYEFIKYFKLEPKASCFRMCAMPSRRTFSICPGD